MALVARRADAPSDRAAYAGILALGAVLFWLSRYHPSLMPMWAPWDFSTPEYLATALTLLWFWRGLALAPAPARPAAACKETISGLRPDWEIVSASAPSSRSGA